MKITVALPGGTSEEVDLGTTGINSDAYVAARTAEIPVGSMVDTGASTARYEGDNRWAQIGTDGAVIKTVTIDAARQSVMHRMYATQRARIAISMGRMA